MTVIKEVRMSERYDVTALLWQYVWNPDPRSLHFKFQWTSKFLLWFRSHWLVSIFTFTKRHWIVIYTIGAYMACDLHVSLQCCFFVIKTNHDHTNNNHDYFWQSNCHRVLPVATNEAFPCSMDRYLTIYVQQFRRHWSYLYVDASEMIWSFSIQSLGHQNYIRNH